MSCNLLQSRCSENAFSHVVRVVPANVQFLIQANSFINGQRNGNFSVVSKTRSSNQSLIFLLLHRFLRRESVSIEKVVSRQYFPNQHSPAIFSIRLSVLTFEREGSSNKEWEDDRGKVQVVIAPYYQYWNEMGVPLLFEGTATHLMIDTPSIEFQHVHTYE